MMPGFAYPLLHPPLALASIIRHPTSILASLTRQCEQRAEIYLVPGQHTKWRREATRRAQRSSRIDYRSSNYHHFLISSLLRSEQKTLCLEWNPVPKFGYQVGDSELPYLDHNSKKDRKATLQLFPMEQEEIGLQQTQTHPQNLRQNELKPRRAIAKKGASFFSLERKVERSRKVTLQLRKLFSAPSNPTTGSRDYLPEEPSLTQPNDPTGRLRKLYLSSFFNIASVCMCISHRRD